MMDNHDIKNFECISDLILPGDVLVDVGSNVGDYTEFFRNKIGDDGKIYSIELSPDTYEILKTKFGHYHNVTILNKAISNINGLIPYYNGTNSATNNIIGHDMDYNPNNHAGEIEGIRLDTLLNDEPSIKLIKIDVEGAEKMVLEGMENIIKKVSYILLECHLDNDWPEIMGLILNKFNLDCFNIFNDDKITQESIRPYQCLCKKK
jgi:FkbM family methyltransferase